MARIKVPKKNAKPADGLSDAQLASRAILRKSEEARKDLAKFYEFVIKHETTKKPLKPAPHQELLFSFIMHHDRAVVRMPIGSSKTFTMAAASLWMLGNDVTQRGALVGASQAQSKKVLAMVKDYIDDDTLNQPVILCFPHLRRSLRGDDPWTQTAIEVERPAGIRDPSLMAVGMDGKIGGSRISWLVGDDMVDDMNTATAAAREATQSNFDGRLMSRLDPVGGRALVCNTPWHRCLLPGSMVETDSGLVPIEEISPGDNVLTTDGLQGVLATGARDHDGEIVKLSCYGNTWPVCVTPEHKVMTQRGWVKAESIAECDWLVSPLPSGETTRQQLIDLLPIPGEKEPSRLEKLKPFTCDEHRSEWKNKISDTKRKMGEEKRRKRLCPGLLGMLVDYGFTYAQIAKQVGLPSKHAVYHYAVRYGTRRRSENTVTGIPTIDPGFWRTVGIWIAEGSITYGWDKKKQSVVVFSLGPTEDYLADDIQKTMEKYGIKVSRSYHDHGIKVQFSSWQIASILKQFGTEATEKKMPEWATRLPEKHARELIRGFVEGDGSTTARWFRISSSSKCLLDGTRRMLGRIGICSSIMKCSPPREVTICGRVVNSSQSYELRFYAGDAQWMLGKWKGTRIPVVDWEKARTTGGRKLTSKIIDNRIYSKIKTIEKEKYNGEVFDLKTPAANFVAESFVVHNSDLTYHLEKNAGWPTITMDIYGYIRFSNADASWMKTALDEHVRISHTRRGGDKKWYRLKKFDPDPQEKTPLWPERYSAENIYKIRYGSSGRGGMLPKEFARLFLCEPISDDSARCQREWVERCKLRGMGDTMVSTYNGPNPTYTGVDLAIGKGKRNDKTTLFTIEVFQDGTRKILDIDSGRFDGPAIIKKIIDKTEKYNSSATVESNAAQDFIRQFAVALRKDLVVHAHTTSKANKLSIDFGVESIFTELKNEAWIIPCDEDGNVHEEIQQWIDDMLYFQPPPAHTGDHLMACWIARESSRRGGSHDPAPTVSRTRQLVNQGGF